MLALTGAAPSQAQAPAPAVKPLDAETFLRLAHSSAVTQARAAELAATRDTRPEVKAYAQRMVAFRREQLPKLQAAAQAARTALPAVLEMEHRVVLENLEPLDYLALSRRYAEFQVQALDQEIQIYAGGAAGPSEAIRPLAAETAPRLRELLEQARQVTEAVGP
jgi:predicted outer membrane protein